jgi:hypothetical protein
VKWSRALCEEEIGGCFHIWRGGGTKATAGCTTMPEANLKELISKIDPNKHPVYILLTSDDYKKYKASWKLP